MNYICFDKSDFNESDINITQYLIFFANKKQYYIYYGHYYPSKANNQLLKFLSPMVPSLKSKAFCDAFGQGHDG